MHIADGALAAPVLFAGGALTAAGTIVGLRKLTMETIPAAGVLNPLTINGRPVIGQPGGEPTRVGPTDVVQFGATAVALRVFGRSFDTERDQLGQ